MIAMAIFFFIVSLCVFVVAIASVNKSWYAAGVLVWCAIGFFIIAFCAGITAGIMRYLA